MQKTDASVQRLVEMIKSWEPPLPEMQRGYVWKGTWVRDLLDSFYRGYPSGNRLVWEREESSRCATWLGRYTVAVKVIGIFGSDTMTLAPVTVA